MPGFEFWGNEEKTAVNDVLETGILMRYGFDGPRKGQWKAKELEQEICNTFGCQHAQLVSSGTAALTTALAVLGIGAGDEVIIPTFTFVASFESVISVGAIPVLVDVDESLTLNPAAVEAAITPRTKCIMPVHMCGSMADMDALVAICKEHDLVLLEDACQSIGATYNGKAVGTIGHAGTFSFDFVKTITCGEGGVIMTNSTEVYEKCDAYSDHGHDHKGVDRGADLHPYLGYNFRISELHAAVGVAQIKKLDKILATQRRNNHLLREILSEVEEITFRTLHDPAGDNASFLSFFLPTEEITRAFVAEMKAQNALGGHFYWYVNNWHYINQWQHFKGSLSLNAQSQAIENALKNYEGKTFPASDAIMSRCISTGISLLWTESQIMEKGKQMVSVIKNVLANQASTITF
jgi:8-amino-3,8-dideoxy-alpha-D-manno-octulosonate transaminase